MERPIHQIGVSQLRLDNVHSENIFGEERGLSVATFPTSAVPGYQFEAVPDLSRLATREHLSQPAIDGLFGIAERWHLPIEMVGELLGGVLRSSLYAL